MIHRDMTIDAILNKVPEALEYLVSKGIDCCCGGTNKLSEEAAKVQVNVDEVVEALNGYEQK